MKQRGAVDKVVYWYSAGGGPIPYFNPETLSNSR